MWKVQRAIKEVSKYTLKQNKRFAKQDIKDYNKLIKMTNKRIKLCANIGDTRLDVWESDYPILKRETIRLMFLTYYADLGYTITIDKGFYTISWKELRR